MIGDKGIILMGEAVNAFVEFKYVELTVTYIIITIVIVVLYKLFKD